MVTRCIWFGFVIFVLVLVIAFVFGVCCCLLSGVGEGDNFARVPMLQTFSLALKGPGLCLYQICDYLHGPPM